MRQAQQRRALKIQEIHWGRVARLLEARQKALQEPAGSAKRELGGTWVFGPKGEIWTFSRKDDGTYSAQEHGFGNATGTATVSGDNMHLQFVVMLQGKQAKGEYRGTFSSDGSTIQATRYPDGSRFTFRRR